MANLRIETRPDGSLLLTDAGGARWGMAAAGIGVGSLVLASVAAGQVTLFGSVAALPFGLIALLAGIGAARHRDWILFDRRGREIVFRRGLASIFRPVSAFPFDEVEGIRVDDGEGAGALAVDLLRAGDFEWPVDASPDAAYVSRLVTALREVGGWPVLRGEAPEAGTEERR